MFDISEQLFPNLITILVQLCATGVIFIMYKKYLHQIVLDFIDKKADAFQKEYIEL
jgi:F-type H+-transporting ATPase subunit b